MSSGELIHLKTQKKELSLVRCLMMDSLRMESELYDTIERYYAMDFEYEPDMFYYAQGSEECPMCLVAHWDTLATYPLQLKMVGQIITRKGKGILGADDRAGVWAIFEVLRRLSSANKPLPSILLTNYEEKGGLGVKSWIDKIGLNCEDVLFIELDRKGANQYVDYSYPLPKQITNYMARFGFIQHSGTYSDIADISDEFLIPSVNVSVGYYEQHSKDERLHCDE